MHTFRVHFHIHATNAICSAVCHLHLINTANSTSSLISASSPQQLCCPDSQPQARTENRAAKMDIREGNFANCASLAPTLKLQISPHSWQLFPVLRPELQLMPRRGRPELQLMPRRPLRQRWLQVSCLHPRLRHRHS